MREGREDSLPDGWQCAVRRGCKEVGTVPGVIEVHPSLYDPGDDTECPSARTEWWVSGRAREALVVAGRRALVRRSG